MDNNKMLKKINQSEKDIIKVNEQLDNIDIEKASKNFMEMRISEEIAKAQLEGAGVDTSNFAVKSDIAIKTNNLILTTEVTANGGLSVTVDNDGKITIKGTTTTPADIWFKIQPIDITPATYYFGFSNELIKDRTRYSVTILKSSQYGNITTREVTESFSTSAFGIYINKGETIDWSGYIYLNKDKDCGFEMYGTLPIFYTKEEVNNISNSLNEKINAITTNTDRIPIVVFDFDETSLDNRYVALQNAGFTGTWQFSSTALENSKDIINTLIQNGHDISPYAGLSDSDYQDTSNHSTNIAKLKAIVVQELEDMKKLGVYNPVMFSCRGHRGGYVVSEAIKDLKFKYIRCTWGVNQQGEDYYIQSITKPSEKEQFPIALNQYETFDKIKSIVDSRIEQKAPLIMLMCHTMTYDNITESNYFENLVSYIKSLSDNGSVKVMNMREYYENYYPEQGKKDDRIRLVSAINDIKNLSLV